MASTRPNTAPARAAHNARLSQDLVVAENNARIWTLRVDKLRREMKSVTRPLPDPQPVRVPLGPLPCPTAQERRAAKIIQHGLSDADRFIEERLSVVVPEQAKKSPAWVKVTMNVTEKEVVIPGCPFVSDSVFELLFLVHLGPAQYITVFYHKSPEFVYSRWTGMATDREAPLWIEYQHAPAPVLWIERKEALKVVYVAEKSPYNVDSASILNLRNRPPPKVFPRPSRPPPRCQPLGCGRQSPRNLLGSALSIVVRSAR
ncbi:hypothetical protein DFP72DRAFT_901830 [Ephemerocybe angulata]|uniref:Uncharacterized protein n=1 Tax=Ephemerocybe angulata TaxID=980116 RepID=A0A8H6HVA9_9AGAR|nr:hypothetical protein DFP72DRAFT_941579 [Tulosesus angulatus]KAF6753491.1 hypothetical protein DFP72DRAFT_901830 [Tulosesus angulatus]